MEKSILSEYEKDDSDKNIAFILVSIICLLSIIGSLINYFYPFNLNSIQNFFTDSDNVAIFLSLFIFPFISISFFILRKKVGWALVTFFYITEFVMFIKIIIVELNKKVIQLNFNYLIQNKVYLFFIVSVITIVLLFKKSLLNYLEIDRNTFRLTLLFSILASILIVLFIN